MNDKQLEGRFEPGLVCIVLVEPQGPLNLGSVARVMKNFGLSELVLVNPLCDPMGHEAQMMAVHASSLLEQARVVKTLDEALRGCARVIATTANSRLVPQKVQPPRECLPWLLEKGQPAALVFGPEDRGLANHELVQAHRILNIPSHSDYPTLNLAQSVAVCCYELFQSGVNLPNHSDTESTVDIEQLTGFQQQLQSLLLKIGYLYPHTVQKRMAKLRHLFLKADLNQNELAMLRGVLSQVEWALNNADALPDTQEKREENTAEKLD